MYACVVRKENGIWNRKKRERERENDYDSNLSVIFTFVCVPVNRRVNVSRVKNCRRIVILLPSHSK